MDTRLPFGLRSSAGIHARYVWQHCWILNTFVRGLQASHFADDFSLVPGTLRSAEQTAARKAEADRLTKTLRIETRADKNVDGELSLVFLWIRIDSHTLKLSLPREKVENALEVFGEFLGNSN